MAKRRRKNKDAVPRELDRSGKLCLAFVNTAVMRPDNRFRRPDAAARPATAALDRYEDLVAWGKRLGVLTAADAEKLLRRAAEVPAEAAGVFARAIELRAELERIFLKARYKKPPAAPILAPLNAALETVPARRLAPGEDGVVWRWPDPGAALDSMLWPVIASAAELVTSEERRWVDVCANRDCTWLFWDGKSRMRKYCDDLICGNRRRAAKERWRRKH